MLAEDLRRWGDELRAIAEVGLSWSHDNPYDRERYEHVRRVAAQLFATADLRPPEEIERSVFSQLTHVAPMPGGEAAVVDEQERIFLIRRADDQLWAMPGGIFEIGETPAGGAEREAREETGMVVRARELVGVWDSRFSESRSSLQLLQFVFLCEVVAAEGQATTPNEVIDSGWFRGDELPPLSPGHTVRVPAVFAYLRHRTPFFDRSDP